LWYSGDSTRASRLPKLRERRVWRQGASPSGVGRDDVRRSADYLKPVLVAPEELLQGLIPSGG
jgi:hypothetical protein